MTLNKSIFTNGTFNYDNGEDKNLYMSEMPIRPENDTASSCGISDIYI